jgi:peptidoglycan/LPS O-acetylase OafA/YrhL
MNTTRLNRTVNILFVLLALLALGWIGGVLFNWQEIESRPVRLAYIICDFLLVIPVGVVAGIALRRGKSWAKMLFALALGALLFDIAHGVFYTIWDNYFGAPWIFMLVLLLVVAAYTVYAMRTLIQTE